MSRGEAGQSRRGLRGKEKVVQEKVVVEEGRDVVGMAL